jgi:alkylation response protein AidB-like acyl-CoA dehydrogenase
LAALRAAKQGGQAGAPSPDPWKTRGRCCTEALILQNRHLTIEQMRFLMSVHGYGYVSDFPVERTYRDVRVCQIYEGTSEMQKILIGRALA